jgi:hypothetical protein
MDIRKFFKGKLYFVIVSSNVGYVGRQPLRGGDWRVI